MGEAATVLFFRMCFVFVVVIVMMVMVIVMGIVVVVVIVVMVMSDGGRERVVNIQSRNAFSG